MSDLAAAEDRLRALMLASLDGDAASYRVLLAELRDRLHRYFRRRVRADLIDQVEDLVQETLLAMHTRRLTYDQLVVEEWRSPNAEGEEVTRALAAAALEAGPRAFVEPDELEHFLARVEFVARTFPEENLPALGEREVGEALAEMCEGRRSFAELREAARAGELVELLRRRLSPGQTRLLARMAPERVTLARGRTCRVRYELGQAPYVASRLQDFFGMSEGPRIAGGRAPLVLRLLAPNQRPVQVTTDLAGFWSRHYKNVRRELSRRYPRHAWPEDPMQV